MSRQAFQRRIDRVAQTLDPLPDSSFLAFARALIVFGGEEATPTSALQLARYLADSRR